MESSQTATTAVRAWEDAGGWSVGLDIGGTKVLGVLVGPGGTTGPELRLPTRRGAGPVADTAVQAVRQLAAAGGIDPSELTGVGIGLPGIVDPATGRVEHAVNLGIVDGVPLADQVSTALGGVRVRLENDLNVAVLGAAYTDRSADEPVNDLAFIALGTGLAAGLLLDGSLRRGAHRAAGEIGHLVHVPGGLPCPCGQRGCLERYASGSAISAAWPSTTGRPAPVELFEAAAAGDPAAIQVRDGFVRAVVAAVRVLVLSCDVGRIVIGGGVSELGDPLLDAVRGELDREALGSPFLASMSMSARVRLAPSGVPVGAVGAALVGRRQD
ncbi:ROK family protein [Cellulomonas hominis]